MFTFHYKSERDMFVREIKENGLETTLRGFIQDATGTGQALLSLVFSVAFDRLSDEDYEAFVLSVCDEIGYEEDDEQ